MSDAFLMKELRLALEKKEQELKDLRNELALMLDQVAIEAMKSNEFNFNDTAVRSKTFILAAEMVRNYE